MKFLRSIRNPSFQAAFSLFALMVLLLVTLEIPVSKHWCMGKVSTLRTYALAPSCGMMSESADTGVSLAPPTCCRNELTLLAANGLDNDGVVQAHSQVFPSDVIFSLDVTPRNVFVGFASHEKNPYSVGPPPGCTTDLIALYQTYLI